VTCYGRMCHCQQGHPILSAVRPVFSNSTTDVLISMRLYTSTPKTQPTDETELVPYINTTCQSITQNFILYTIKIVYCQGDMQWRTQEFCSGGGGGSTNSVEDRGQGERGSGGGSPLLRGSGGSCN